MCNLVRRAPQNLEKVAKNPVEKIASNPVTSVAVMVFSALIIVNQPQEIAAIWLQNVLQLKSCDTHCWQIVIAISEVLLPENAALVGELPCGFGGCEGELIAICNCDYWCTWAKPLGQIISNKRKMWNDKTKQYSDKKNEHKPKLWGPDIFRWGGCLPSEGVAAKKFGKSLETHGKQTFWRDLPGFGWDIRGCPKSLRKKVCVQFFGDFLRGGGVTEGGDSTPR